MATVAEIAEDLRAMREMEVTCIDANPLVLMAEPGR